jgi:cell division protein FtsL
MIVVVAVLLAGVVALNVGVLRLNLRLDDLSSERAKLRADNAVLAAQLSSAADSLRIQSLASSKLGFVRADPAHLTYVSIAPGR